VAEFEEDGNEDEASEWRKKLAQAQSELA